MRGPYLGVCLVLFVSLLSGCFEDEAPAPEPTREAESEEDLVPRVFEPGALPVPLRYRGDGVNESVANFTGPYPAVGTPAVYPILEGTEIARIPLDDMVPADMPVTVTVAYEKAGWMGFAAWLDVPDGRRVNHGIEGDLFRIEEQSWRVWRSPNMTIDLVLTFTLRGGCICYPPPDWQVQVTTWSRPDLLPAGVPTLVALDPAVPLFIEDVVGDVGDLVVMDPVQGVVYRGSATERNHTLPPSLPANAYVVALQGTGSAAVKAGFSGRALPLEVQLAEMDGRTSYGGVSVRWSEETRQVPWSVGFIIDRGVGASRGEDAWTIEWDGETIYDSSVERGDFSLMFRTPIDYYRVGTDALDTRIGPGTFTFEIQERGSRGEAGSYFGYLVLDGLLPDDGAK